MEQVVDQNSSHPPNDAHPPLKPDGLIIPPRPPEMSGGHWSWGWPDWKFVNDPPVDNSSLYNNPGGDSYRPGVSVDLDVDRNYIPDVLQRPKRRRRRYGRYRVRRSVVRR